MAGEKTKQNTRIVKKPETSTEPLITLTSSQLQEIMAGAFKTAAEQVKSVPAAAVSQIENSIMTTLTKRINDRNIAGQRFDNFLADPNGPRTRIVIDRIYREYVGNEITATVNGNTVKVPVDGRPYPVHPAHFAAIKAKLEYISKTRDRAVDIPDVFRGEDDDIGDYQKIGQR